MMTISAVDLSPLQDHFPALQETDAQGHRIFLMVRSVIRCHWRSLTAVTHQYTHANSVAGYNFITSWSDPL
jgi:hypothetical protein